MNESFVNLQRSTARQQPHEELPAPTHFARRPRTAGPGRSRKFFEPLDRAAKGMVRAIALAAGAEDASPPPPPRIAS